MTEDDFKEQVLAVMFHVNDKCELWNSDEIFSEAQARGLDAKRIGKYLPNLFKTLKSWGLITKTNQFRLSRRQGNSSSPLPLWKRGGN